MWDSVSIPGSGRSPGGGHDNRSSVLAWGIPWTEEPGGLPSTALQRARHDWVTNTHTYMCATLVPCCVRPWCEHSLLHSFLKISVSVNILWFHEHVEYLIGCEGGWFHTICDILPSCFFFLLLPFSSISFRSLDAPVGSSCVIDSSLQWSSPTRSPFLPGHCPEVWWANILNFLIGSLELTCTYCYI